MGDSAPLSSLATSIYPSEQPSNASGFQEKLLPPEVQGPRVPMGAGGSRYMTLSQRKKLHGKSKTFGALNPLHVATNIKEDPVEEDEDVSQETDEEDESPTKTSAQSTAVPKKRKRAPRTSRVSMGKSRMIVDDEDSRSTTSTRRKELASARLRKSALLTAKTKTLSTNAANARRVKVPRPPPPPKDLTLADVFSYTPCLSSGIVGPYLANDSIDKRSVFKFKQDVADSVKRFRERKASVWFIVEEPYWSMQVNEATMASAIITKVPRLFRPRHLHTVISETSFRGCEITHVITTLTSNYMCQYDTNQIDAKEEFKTIIECTTTALRKQLSSFKSFILLGYPVLSQYRLAYASLSDILIGLTIDIRKQQEKFVQWCPVDGNDEQQYKKCLERLPSLLISVFEGNNTAALICMSK